MSDIVYEHSPCRCKACRSPLKITYSVCVQPDGKRSASVVDGDYACHECGADFAVVTIQAGLRRMTLPFIKQDDPLVMLSKAGDK